MGTIPHDQYLAWHITTTTVCSSCEYTNAVGFVTLLLYTNAVGFVTFQNCESYAALVFNAGPGFLIGPAFPHFLFDYVPMRLSINTAVGRKSM